MTSTPTSVYQQLRSHLAYLRLAAAAEALPEHLEHATKAELGHTAFLERLLAVEVAATAQRRQASLERFASLPAPWRLGGRCETACLGGSECVRCWRRHGRGRREVDVSDAFSRWVSADGKVEGRRWRVQATAVHPLAGW
jgi:hypothetical protein